LDYPSTEMSDELFDLPTSTLPPLEAARRRLTAAQAALFAIDIDGTDDIGLATEQAEKELEAATHEVVRLEIKTLSRETQSHAATGTSTTRPGGRS
jgi:hypothetical protein